MNEIYVCKVSGFQARGNQIDIPKQVGTDFFKVPLENIENSKNTGINICHISDVRTFENIEIQPATNLRWSTKLNKFLSEKGESLNEGDLLIFERLGRSYCVRAISNSDDKYDALIEFFDENEKHLLLSSSIEIQPKEKNKTNPDSDDSRILLQKIFYGAPGTGKSYKVNEVTSNQPKDNVFRITFHPDSDYSTFVGCYKPTRTRSVSILNKGKLIAELTKIKESGVTYPCHRFACKYWESLKEVSREETIEILAACGFSESMYAEIGKCVAVGEGESKGKSSITYSYVPQSFIKAYVRACQTEEPVYLVIEEINRGNCAQIFGDIFQLLDRDENGVSSYAVKPDSDLENYLKENLGDKYDEEEGMRLPKNLHIWATMNTSDQSLFPIDSAFKRRWDWEYVPIQYKNTDWKIALGNMRYSWVEFQEKVNDLIFAATDSEDKQMGDYFVRADVNKVIGEDVLFNKIVFYLWNDVCKDGEGEIFRVKRDGEKDAQDITFSKFLKGDRTKNLQDWMAYLGVTAEAEKNEDDEHSTDEEEEPETPTSDLKEAQLNFWTKFKKYMLDQGEEDNLEVSAKRYRDYSLGMTGAFVSNTIHCRLGRIRSQIYINTQAKELGPWLKERADEIEQNLGYGLEWRITDKGTATFRFVETGFDFDKDESVDKAIKIMAEKTKSLKEVFLPYINQYRKEQK